MKTQNPAQKNRLFKETQKILNGLMMTWPQNPYAYNTYAEILMDKSNEMEGEAKHECLKEAHVAIQNGIRFCPDKSYLQATEAKIFQTLGDYKNAKAALLASHRSDPSSTRTSLLLGRLLQRNKEYSLALEVVTTTLRYNENYEALNVLAAEIALVQAPNQHDKIIGFLKKAFDPNYIDKKANFLLGVEYFRKYEFKEAEDIFSNFRRKKLYTRDSSSYYVTEYMKDEQGRVTEFQGQVKNLFGNKGFIAADLLEQDIYFIPNEVRGGTVSRGTRVIFEIGFNLFGPIAKRIRTRN